MKKIALIGATILAIGTLTACSEMDEATPTSMCAWITGDGDDGRDANVEKVVYPGQVVDLDEAGGQESWYVPCNPRNYIVSDGQKEDSNGQPIGDRFKPSEAITKEGTRVLVYWTAYWMVNQTESVFKKDFYNFCYKYKCASGDPDSGDANNSTEGWNDMLGENFSTAGDRLVRKQAPLALTDASWKLDDQKEWDALAVLLSQNFADEIRPNSGTSADLFCSSYDGAWTDPNKPGEGEFTCKPVFFTVDKIVNADANTQKAQDASTVAQQQADANKKLLDAAKAKYGENAGDWLAFFDALDKCKATGVDCKPIFGNSGAPSVLVSSSSSKSDN